MLVAMLFTSVVLAPRARGTGWRSNGKLYFRVVEDFIVTLLGDCWKTTGVDWIALSGCDNCLCP